MILLFIALYLMFGTTIAYHFDRIFDISFLKWLFILFTWPIVIVAIILF